MPGTSGPQASLLSSEEWEEPGLWSPRPGKRTLALDYAGPGGSPGLAIPHSLAVESHTHHLSGCVPNCLTGCRGTGTCLVSQGTMGLGIKMSLALFPMLAQSRAKEKTQDGPRPLTAEGHMTLAMGAGGLPETFVGEVLGVTDQSSVKPGSSSVGHG